MLIMKFQIDQYNYVRWLPVHIQDFLSLPTTCLNIYQKFDRGNFVVQISGSQSSLIHYDQPINKTINYGLNCASSKLQSRWEIIGPKTEKYLRQVKGKILRGINQNDIHNHEHNPTHNAMFTKDYTTMVGRLLPINQFLKDSFIKVGPGITNSEKMHAFFDSIPEVC